MKSESIREFLERQGLHRVDKLRFRKKYYDGTSLFVEATDKGTFNRSMRVTPRYVKEKRIKIYRLNTRTGNVTNGGWIGFNRTKLTKTRLNPSIPKAYDREVNKLEHQPLSYIPR